MKILVNALSVTNQSGRHVLMGHLSRLAEWSGGRHSFDVLYHDVNRDMVCVLGERVRWHRCPAYCAKWVGRATWERMRLPSLAAKLNADCLFTPAGVAVPGLHIPQLVFCQNPWCLVPDILGSPADRLKAALQRHAYKDAMKRAAVMVFNSEFMQRAYRENAGFDTKKSTVVYQGISDDTYRAAEKIRGQVARKTHQIVTVSAMGNHKGVETVVRALHRLRKNEGLPVTLKLIGSWPAAAYEQMIRNLVRELKLDEAVQFAGHVSIEELHQSYAESRVFCLMSQCESFGIPAVEAQAFGTPAVSSNCCAMPEVEGAGGLYPEVNDPRGTADALLRLIADDSFWQEMSEKAVLNATRYHWDLCSMPLLKIIDELAGNE